MRDNRCVWCGFPGHRSSQCKVPRVWLAVFLAGMLIVGPAPAMQRVQQDNAVVHIPIPIATARACAADPLGCVILTATMLEAIKEHAAEKAVQQCPGRSS